MPDVISEAFELRAFIPYLLARVGSLTALSIAPQLEAAGITLHMWRVLMVLHFQGPLTLVELSRIIGVKTSTLSRLVGRMVDKKLVSRQRSREDARTVQISLKRDGEAVFRDLWPHAARVQDLVTSRFPPAEFERFKTMLQEIETMLVSQVERASKPSRHKKAAEQTDSGAA